MALTSWSTSNYLYTASLPVTAAPLLISAWVYRNSGTGTHRTVAALGQSPATNNYHGLRIESSGNLVQAQSYDATTYGAATSSSAPGSAQWQHIAGFWLTNAARYAYVAGGNRGLDTANTTPSAPTRMTIGFILDDGTVLNSADGLGEISIWDGTGFSLADGDSLVAKLNNGGGGGNGANPVSVNAESAQPWTGKLAAYYPLPDDTDLTDHAVTSHDLSMQGTLTNWGGSAPPVDSEQPVPVEFHRLAYRLF